MNKAAVSLTLVASALSTTTEVLEKIGGYEMYGSNTCEANYLFEAGGWIMNQCVQKKQEDSTFSYKKWNCRKATESDEGQSGNFYISWENFDDSQCSTPSEVVGGGNWWPVDTCVSWGTLTNSEEEANLFVKMYCDEGEPDVTNRIEKLASMDGRFLTYFPDEANCVDEENSNPFQFRLDTSYDNSNDNGIDISCGLQENKVYGACGWTRYGGDNCMGGAVESKSYFDDIPERCSGVSDEEAFVGLPQYDNRVVGSYIKCETNQCPVNIETSSLAMRVSKKRWATDDVLTNSPSADVCKNTEGVNYPVSRFNLLSIKSVIHSATQDCLYAIFTLENKKDFETLQQYMETFVLTFTIFDKDSSQILFQQQHLPLFAEVSAPNPILSRILLPEGSTEAKFSLQFDFSKFGLRFSDYQDYFVNLEVSQLGERGQNNIDCVTLRHADNRPQEEVIVSRS